MNNNDLVSIGTAKVGAIKGIADTATTTFAGQTVLGSDTIAMVTWGGDANLDGKINIDDYGQIDFNVGIERLGLRLVQRRLQLRRQDQHRRLRHHRLQRLGAEQHLPDRGRAPRRDLDGVAAVPEPAGPCGLALVRQA